jgi:hypothetical protein
MAGEKHKIGFILFVVAALLAGCSAAPGLKTATPAASPGIDHPTLTATGVPGVGATMPAATATAEAVKAGVIKVNPPKLPVGPVPGGPPPTLAAGWQTYTSPALGVAVDYPKDWAVTENGAGASFTSPQGVTIALEGGQVRPTASPAGQDCSDVINTNGRTAETCFDAAASRYSALFKMPAGAATAWVVLSTISKEKPVVYLQMFDSLRPLP